MLSKSKYVLFFSVLIFIIDFFVLGNVNFTQNKILQSIGRVVGITSLISILASFILVVISLIRKKAQNSPKPPAQVKNKGKKFIGLFILVWLLVIFPFIGVFKTGLISRIFGENAEVAGTSFFARLAFLIMIIIGVGYPALYFFPLIFLATPPLILLMFYFLFSRSWHKRVDIIMVVITLILMASQVGSLISLVGSK